MERSILYSFYLILCFAILFSCKEEQPAQPPNILLICIDDLRPDLKSFGVEHISSPHIDKLTESGVSFLRHYVNAPSCGPSRFTLLTGLYGPPSNQALFQRSKKIAEGTEAVHPSMPEWFRSRDYTTVSVGKVSHHPGGLGGENWDTDTIVEMPNAWDRHLMPTGEWDHPRGSMHGLAHGEIRVKASEMDAFQSEDGADDIYPDGLITTEALNQLDLLSGDNSKPFFLAVGIIKPHLPFGAPASYLENYKGVDLPPIAHPEKPSGRSTWHRSGEFRQYNHHGKDANEDPVYADQLRRHYSACVSYADAQVGRILAALKKSGADQNTIVVLWGDHGWHLGEHGIWGKHSLFEESLRSPLIIHTPAMKHEGASTNAVVESVDIFPTLCDLAGLEKPEFAQGKSLQRNLEDPDLSGHTALGYIGKAKTIRTPTHRMILHDDGYVELYDHTTEEKETHNIATQNDDMVKQLKEELAAKTKL